MTLTITHEPADDTIDPETYSDEGYVAHTVEVALAGVSVTADVWRRVGYVQPRAHMDLDGSGLELWGDSQYGEWRVLWSDGLDMGTRELREALAAALGREGVDLDEVISLDDVIDRVKDSAPDVAEPDDDWWVERADEDDLAGRGWSLVEGWGTSALVYRAGSTDEVVLHPGKATARAVGDAIGVATADTIEAALEEAD